MASTISAGLTTTTSLSFSGDTSGVLQLQTNGTTTALTLDTSQNATFAGKVTSAGALTLASNGSTTAVTVDTSQNVNIGNTGINSNFRLNLTSPSGNGGIVFVPASDGSAVPVLRMLNAAISTNVAEIGTASGTALYFSTGGTERARIDNSGVLAVGTSTTSSATRLVVQGSGTGSSTLASFKNSSASTVFSILENCTTTITGSSVNGRQLTLNSTASGDAGYASFGIIKYDNNTSTSQIFQQFFIGNGGVSSGQINANGANQAAFGAYSDITLKTNIVPLGPQLANINKIEVIEFDYIESEGGGHQIGFSAQNMQTIYPDTVGTRADGKLTLTGWNKTEARLVKAIQELSAQVTTLQSQVAALKA